MADEDPVALEDLQELENKVKEVQAEFATSPPPQEEEEKPSTPYSDFPPQIVEALDGLTWLGYLEDQFELFAHTFVIRTLRGDEELLAAQLCTEWANTLGQAKAWIWSQLALCLISVDGNTNWCPPIGPDPKTHARDKFNYLTQHWFWATAEYIYGRYTDLLIRQEEAFKALESL